MPGRELAVDREGPGEAVHSDPDLACRRGWVPVCAPRRPRERKCEQEPVRSGVVDGRDGDGGDSVGRESVRVNERERERERTRDLMVSRGGGGRDA